MMSKAKLKRDIKKLIERYEDMCKDKSSHTEADVQTKLIKPLFKSLGWDVEGEKDINEVKEEVNLEGKKADLIFRLNLVTRLVVENKRLSVDIHNNQNKRKEGIEQAAIYGHSADVSCTILTNFEHFIIIDSQKDYESPTEAIYKELSYKDLITEAGLRTLELFTKDGFEENLWNEELKLIPSRRVAKSPIDQQLLDEMIHWRYQLYRDIKKRYPNYNNGKIDDIIQIILNRFIFIRKCEGKGFLESKSLFSLYHQFKDKKLKKLFSQVEKKYDGLLFEEHECDKIIIGNSILKEIILELYWSRDKKIKYDFSAIPSDILGKMYEQYLGNLVDEKNISKFRSKRKSEGIYYTPFRIVNYIVNSSLGEYLDSQKKLSNIHLLDPTSGSGSFLTNAYDYIENYYSKRENLTYHKKCNIITKNIYGVDKDTRAIEISRLNLHFKLLEKNKRLPEMDNLKEGDSLIDDSSVAGDKAFQWKKEYPEVCSLQGFDVIVGNPPYVFGGGKGIKKEEKEYFKKNYISAKNKLNLFALFIEKSIDLLKEGGILGFILPNSLLRVTSYEEIRKLILEKTSILKIINLKPGVFEGVTASTIIIILQKEKSREKREENLIKISEGLENQFSLKSQKEFFNYLHIFDIISSENSRDLKNKLKRNSIELGKITKEMIFGVVIAGNKKEVISNKKRNNKYKKFLEGRDIDPYQIKHSNQFLLYEKSKLHRARSPAIFEVKEKILMQRISGGKKPLIAAYDDKQFYTKESINNIILSNDKFKAKYILALLNSKLINWFYAATFTNASDLTVNVSKAYLSDIPIKEIEVNKQNEVIKLVDKLISLKKLKETPEIMKKINEIENQIDKLTYDFYNLTNEEVRYVEDYFNS